MTIYKRHPKSVFSHPFFSTVFEPELAPRSATAPWDLVKTGDNDWRIEAVLAGLDLDDIDITQDGQTLAITTKALEPGAGEYLRQGRNLDAVDLSFRLGEHVEVTSASLDKGILSVSLSRNLPEELQPRKIAVEAGHQDA